MSNKGLVVPDNPAPDISTWKTVPFLIPDDPQWIGIIRGLLYSPCNGYWWKKNSGEWEDARDTMCRIASEFNMATFCEQVAECIIDDGGGTQTIINNTVNNYYFGDPQGGLGNGISGVDVCNDDVLFGITSQLVTYLDSQAREAFQVIEEATNQFELITTWIDNVPIVSTAIAPLLEYVQWIQDQVVEEYEAEWGTALYDEYRCDLFCMWRDDPNCQLSVEDIAKYFIERLAGSFDILETLQGFLNFITLGTWSGTQFVDVMMLAMTGLMSIREIRLPFITIKNVYSYETVVALASNDPDPDWTILCDCALPVWCRTWFGGEGNVPAWTINTVAGVTATYNAIDDRIESADNPVPSTFTILDISIDVGVPIESMSVGYSYRVTRASGNVAIRNGAVTLASASLGVTTGTGVLNWNPIEHVTIATISVRANSGSVSAGDASYMYVTSVTINGKEINPYGISNC